MANPLEIAKQALARAIEEKKRGQELISSLGPAVVETLKPILEEIASNSKLSKEELLSAIANIKIDVPQAQIPQAQIDVKIPEIKVPAPQVTVNVPDLKMPPMPEIKLPKITVPKPEVTVNFDASKIKIPDVVMPDEMNVKGWVSLMGVDLNNPLPVQLRDAKGNPVKLFENLTQIMSGGTGFRHVVVDKMPSVSTAVQTNPTPVSDGAISVIKTDDLGRTITRPIQVRDLMATAFVTITDSSEDTLISGVASTYLDLIYVLAANESDAAVNLAFRTGTGGSTMFELEVPASSTAGVSLPVPIPASEVAQAWTVQNTGSDNSNTTVNISALFSKEV